MSSAWPQFPRYIDPLRQWRDLAASRIALVDRAADHRYSYRELDALADKWAALLAAQRVLRGDRVAVVAGNRIDVIALFFACTRIGAALVPVNWRLARSELNAILDHASPKLVIGESRFLSLLDASVSVNELIDLDSDAPRLLKSSVRE